MEEPRLEGFAVYGLVKYGLWTLFVVILYRGDYFSMGRGTYNMVIFSLHVAMALLGFILLPYVWRNRDRVSSMDLNLWFAFFLACDLADYVIGTHPYLPSEEVGVVAAHSFLETVLIWVWLRKRHSIGKE